MHTGRGTGKNTSSCYYTFTAPQNIASLAFHHKKSSLGTTLLPHTECSSSVWSCKLLWSIAEEASWAERTCISNIVESAEQQRQFYHSGGNIRLAVGQKVFVSNPIRGKLNPGPWTVKKQIDLTSVKVKMGTREQIIYMNRICPLLLKDTSPWETLTWEPPLFTQDDES